MAYRNIIVESEATLTLKNKQMRIKTEQVDTTEPIEDISTLLVENRRSVLSVALLSALAQNGSVVFICDEFHMPCAVLEPYLQHSRQHEVTKNQLTLTAPAKKQLWKQIIAAKIRNQAKCLSLCNHADTVFEVTQKLEKMANQVRSGDEGHSEGHAAALYFPALFGSGYLRSNDSDYRNAWLNYGYAILRGCIARMLCVYGFFPLYGIKHHSSLNQFNLADDFIEPFRPIVDLFTIQNALQETGLSPQNKRQIANLLNYDICVAGNMYALSYAIERTIKSFSAVCAGNRKDLLLPELVPLNQHSYE
ncbi:MAG: type II CRISPR-associated endonuclease Cas1 [Defluviitaleaceae bacterium]|nr:type II CRISPR-associated endonuclease Cas1 [Defluviitaleaceae bacterium]